MMYSEEFERWMMDEYKVAIRQVFDDMRPYLTPEGVTRVRDCIRDLDGVEFISQLIGNKVAKFGPVMLEEMEAAKSIGTLPPEEWPLMEKLRGKYHLKKKNLH